MLQVTQRQVPGTVVAAASWPGFWGCHPHQDFLGLQWPWEGALPGPWPPVGCKGGHVLLPAQGLPPPRAPQSSLCQRLWPQR